LFRICAFYDLAGVETFAIHAALTGFTLNLGTGIWQAFSLDTDQRRITAEHIAVWLNAEAFGANRTIWATDLLTLWINALPFFPKRNFIRILTRARALHARSIQTYFSISKAFRAFVAGEIAFPTEADRRAVITDGFVCFVSETVAVVIDIITYFFGWLGHRAIRPDARLAVSFPDAADAFTRLSDEVHDTVAIIIETITDLFADFHGTFAPNA